MIQVPEMVATYMWEHQIHVNPEQMTPEVFKLQVAQNMLLMRMNKQKEIQQMIKIYYRGIYDRSREI